MGSLNFNLLKLAGFKSFVEPTTFMIQPGLTGVVGPNGCGKSNLLEAIRWVMGANSAKAMRASGMDDVIFSGTKSRPGRGQASVTLTIDNSARIAPSMFNDDDTLEVTRTITKGAGSKYQVNGKTVRAKDVQLLFADASTGANSPALVRQGQINELISAKPSNRRRILEEAAGISGLHTRRHEAELRLRAAETNLDRLDDVLGQIESQLLSLRRQSRQAARYKRLAGEIREYKTLLWLRRWEQALASLTENAEALKACESKVADLTGQTAALTTQAADISAKLEPMREEQIVAAAVYGRLNAAREALENDEQLAASELKKLEGRLAFLISDIERENGIISDSETAIARLSEEQAELKAGEDISGAVEAAGIEAEKAQNIRSDLETKLGELTRRAGEFDAKKRAAENAYSDLSARKARIASEAGSVKDKISAAEAENAQASSQSLFGASLEDAQKALEKARAYDEDAAREKQEAETFERTAREALSAVRAEAGDIKAEHKALTALLQNSRGDVNWAPALESIHVDKGYETALAAAFGDDLDAGLDTDLPLRWTGAQTPSASLPGGAAALSQYVKAPTQLSARLSQIGVVDTEAEAKSLFSQLKPGQRLVTKDGALWRWDGFAADAGTPSAAAIKLENLGRLAELDTQLAEIDERLAAAQTEWERTRTVRELADKDAQNARQALPPLERAERDAQVAMSRFETDQARRSEQLSALRDRFERLSTELKDVTAREIDAKSAFEAFGDNAELEQKMQAVGEELRAAREAADEAGAHFRSLRNELESRKTRLAAIDRDLADWTRRAADAKQRISSLEGREAETKMALAAAHDSPDSFAKRKQTLLSELSQSEDRRIKANDAVAEIESALRAAEGDLRERETQLGQAREARAAAEARLTAATERRDEIQARIAETLSCAPSELKGQLEELSPESGMAEHAIEQKLERLTRERENMGAVNMRADEEAEEQEQRLAALTHEKNDLIAAIARLRSGIDSLNAEGRERLLQAFDTVNGHFGRLFTRLFGGGSASLALTESDDPLEAGLEVLVSPPGKKLGSMSLMSGGEQALTATALIFAVFLSNPAPICVLDEVDAPLDDANVERFCNLLDAMCEETTTRFMVITHNAVSMARMDRLFGVTMAEKGVSQLVSIDLSAAEKLTAA